MILKHCGSFHAMDGVKKKKNLTKKLLCFAGLGFLLRSGFNKKFSRYMYYKFWQNYHSTTFVTAVYISIFICWCCLTNFIWSGCVCVCGLSVRTVCTWPCNRTVHEQEVIGCEWMSRPVQTLVNVTWLHSYSPPAYWLMFHGYHLDAVFVIWHGMTVSTYLCHLLLCVLSQLQSVLNF